MDSSSNNTFLTLPLEIRQTTYGHVFTGSFVKFSAERSPLQNCTYALDISKQSSSAHCILRTCSQIHAEAIDVYYKQTVFVMKDILVREHVGYFATYYDDRSSFNESNNGSARNDSDHRLRNSIKRVQRLVVSDHRVLEFLGSDMPELTHLFIEPAGDFNLLHLIWSEKIQDRIAEAKEMDFAVFWQTRSKIPCFWFGSSILRGEIRTLLRRHPSLNTILKVRAAIATQGWTRLKCTYLVDFRKETMRMTQVDDPLGYQGPHLL